MRQILLICTLALAAVISSTATAAPDRPNIIFILADDLGRGDIGCYGQKLIQTPNLDRMAAEGIRFSTAYCGTSVCAPSRCALMTGLHMGHAPIRANQEITPEGQMPLPAGTVTVARVLQQAGYRTACIGKWGLGYPGSGSEATHMGFDYFFGYNCQRHAHNYYTTYLWRNDEHVLLPGNADGKRGQYSHDALVEDALTWVRKQSSEPFFLYLALTIPHAQWTVPDQAPYEDKPWPDTEKTFAAMVTRMDTGVGQLMALLTELGIDDKTFVLFASDNGPAEDYGEHKTEFFDGNGPYRGVKRELYEGGLLVPAIARWPGKIKPNTVSDEMWAFWDFLPTAVELAGAKLPDGLKTDGISFVPALLGKTMPERQCFYWELHEGPIKQAVRFGKYKAVRNDMKKPLELFDLQTDPGESRNLAGEKPDVLAQAEDLIKASRTDSPDWPTDASKQKRMSRLKARYAEQSKHYLVRAGQPAACIVVGKSPDPSINQAAELLNSTLAARSGARLPIVDEPNPAATNLAIYLGLIGDPLPFGLDVPDSLLAAKAQNQDGIILRSIVIKRRSYLFVGGTNSQSTTLAVNKLLASLTIAGQDATLSPMGVAEVVSPR